MSFDEGSQLGKFYFGEQNANIYLPQDGEEYAIVSVGRDAPWHVSTMPVNFKANADGQYTLTVNPENVEMSYLHLIDNMTGADVDLLATDGGDAKHGDARPCVSTYTFEAKTTDYESRFKLVFAANSMDADDDNEAPFAYYADGEIIVFANEGTASLQVIDMTGRVIFSRDAARHVSTSGMTPGVYVLRLINENDVKTQRIVVR